MDKEFARNQAKESSAMFLGVFLAVLMVMVPFILCLVVNNNYVQIDVAPLALSLSGATLLIYVVNVIIYYSTAHKYKNLKSEDFLNMMLQNKEETRKDPILARKKVTHSYLYAMLYSIFCIVLPILAVMSYGFVDLQNASAVIVISMLFTIIVALVIVAEWLNSVFLNIFFKEKPYNLGVQFPKLNAFVKEIVDEELPNKKFNAFLIGGSSINVNEENGVMNINIGTASALLLNDEELKAVLFHELAHVKHKDTKFARIKYSYISGAQLFMCHYEFFTALLCPRTDVLMFQNNITDELAQIYFENLADDDVLSKNISQTFVNAVVKTYALADAVALDYGAFNYELIKNLGYYEAYVQKFIPAYQTYVNSHAKDYSSFAFTYLEERFTTHPNINQRRQKFGVTEICITLDKNDRFLDDVKLFFAEAESERKTKEGKESDEEFVKKYERYLSLVEKYNGGELTSLEDKNDLMDACSSYGNYELLEKLASEIIAEHPENDRATAYLGYVLVRYKMQEDGVKYLEKVIADPTSSFIPMAMEVLGDHYVRTGNVEGRDHIRAVQNNLVDAEMERAKVMVLALNDKAEKYENQEVIQKLIQLVSPCKAIEKVLVCTKRKGSFYCHHVVVLFDGKLAEKKEVEDEIDDIMHKIWMYLDVANDQFNLMAFNKLALPSGHPFNKNAIYVKEK